MPLQTTFGQRALWTAAIVAMLAGTLRAQEAEKPVSRWEPNIARFEQSDRTNPPPKEAILFVGSSSIVAWDLPKFFPDLPVINRGFGGSQIADSVEFADRIVIPYRPKIIVFYAGDNDVASGKTPERVLADYNAFVAKVHKALPETRIIFIAIKPSIARWKLIDTIRAANAIVRAATEKEDTLEFLDIDAPMLGADGKPRPEIFRPDGLHMNADGYRIWTDLLLPHLKLK